MPYTINKTNGGFVATVGDGTLDNSTPLTLIGKNYSGYGEILNENFVKLMENFANSSAPENALAGQLWWDTATKTLKVNTALNTWKIISGSTASSTRPSNATIGDLWFDTLAAQLNVYNGSDWTLIGPSYSSSVGTSGAVVDSILDTIGGSHVVVKYVIGGSDIVSILSKDQAFQPQAHIDGFSTINPGLTISSIISEAGFYGTASNADKLDNLNSTQFMRADANTGTSGTVSVTNDTGVNIGVDGDLRLWVSGQDSYVNNITSNGKIFFRINKAGLATDAMFIDGQTGEVRIPTPLPAANNGTNRVATMEYVDRQASTAAASSGFASGTTMLFVQASAPTGWTKSTSHDNKALRIVSSAGGSSGGSVAFTGAFTSQSVSGSIAAATVSGTTAGHALTVAQMPAHQHNVFHSTETSTSNQQMNANSYIARSNTGVSGLGYVMSQSLNNAAANVGLTSLEGSGQAHSHTFSGGSHTHTFTGNGINLAVQYVDAIIAVKN